jgi:hypothetical protein
MSLAGSLPFTRSGVLDSPDAYILGHTEIEIGLAGSAYTVVDSAGGEDSEFMITAHADVGLFRYVQLGVSYMGQGGIAGNLKVAVISEGIDVPAFAIGVDNISGEKYIDCFTDPDGNFYPYSHAQNWSVYGVVSKDMSYLIGVPATVSLGIGVGRFVGIIENGALGAGSKWAHGLFGSVVYRPSDRIELAFEQDGRDLNLGASYELSRYFTVQLAWAEFEHFISPSESPDERDIMQNSKFTLALESRFGPIIGAHRLELEREQQRIERARSRLQELEDRRRAAEAELQRLRDLLEERN